MDIPRGSPVRWRRWRGVLCGARVLPPRPTDMMLAIDDLSVSYGGLAAFRGVSLTGEGGQFVAIVGPHRGRKTTPFKAISGTGAPRARKIAFQSRGPLPIAPAPPPH